MSLIRRARAGLIAAVAVALTALAPTAAQADATQFTLTVRDGSFAEAGKSFSLSLRPTNGELWQLQRTKLVIDTAEVADFATVWVPNYENGKQIPAKYCTSAGTVLTCDVGTTNWAGLGLPNLIVQAKKGAEVGRSGKLTVTVSAEGLAPLVATPKMTVAEDVDLAVTVGRTPVIGERGQPVTVPIQVTNTGAKPVAGAGVRIVGYDGLQLAGSFTNCGYDRGDQEVHCRFDEVLEPGATYLLSAPTLAVRKNAANDGKNAGYLAMLWSGDDFDEAGILSGLTRGTSGVLKLVKAPATPAALSKTTDSNLANNLAFGQVQIPKVAEPTASASASASPSASRSANPAAGAGGGLPITGAPTAAVVSAGVGLLVLGAAAVLATRRRRSSLDS